MAVHPSSTGYFWGGLTLLNHNGSGELPLVGLVQRVSWDGRQVRTTQSPWDYGVEIALPDGQFVEVSLDYSGGLITASIPEFKNFNEYEFVCNR